MSSNPPTQDDASGGGMADSNNREKPRTKGQVRVRSNVCADRNAWNLVPGDVLKLYDLRFDKDMLIRKQRDEQMYYEPCSICGRKIVAIQRDGCDHPACHKQG